MDFLAKLIIDNHLDFRSLALVLECYHALKRKEVRTLGEVATVLSQRQVVVSRDAIYRTVREFERTIQKEVFLKGSGLGATVIAPDVDPLMRDLEEMLWHFKRILKRASVSPIEIKLGASLSLYEHLVPTVLHDFRVFDSDTGSEAKLERIAATFYRPHELRERARTGELDVVITSSCPDHLGDLENQVEKDLRLQMYLIWARGCGLSPENFRREQLGTYTLVLRSETPGSPPVYPDWVLNHQRIFRTRSFSQSYKMVLASNDNVCLGFPQLFGPLEKRLLDWVTLEGLGRDRLCLIRPKHATSSDTEKDRVIERLVERFGVHLTALEKNFAAERDKNAISNKMERFRGIYHVSKLETVTTREASYAWVRGDLEDFYISEDGVVKGVHAVHAPLGEKPEIRRYFIFGRLVGDPHAETCHMYWSGTTHLNGEPGEEYFANFVLYASDRPNPDLPNHGGARAIVGSWIGRQTYNRREGRFSPSGGYIVLVRELGQDRVGSAFLNGCVRAYEHAFGHIVFKKPGEDDPPPT